MQLKLKNILAVVTVMSTVIGTITAVMTYVNLTPAQSFMPTWLRAFLFAFVVMLPLGGLIFTAIHKLVNTLFSVLSPTHQKGIHAVLMAVAMESIMAIVTTLINHGYVVFPAFMHHVMTSFVYALPIGLLIACLMTFVLHPKLTQLLTDTST